MGRTQTVCNRSFGAVTMRGLTLWERTPAARTCDNLRTYREDDGLRAAGGRSENNAASMPKRSHTKNAGNLVAVDLGVISRGRGLPSLPCIGV